MLIDLRKRELHGGNVVGCQQEGYRFLLPQIDEPCYTLAQVDDYMHLPRGRFPHKPPLKIQLEARISGEDLPGTWGFGLWNDPFSLGFGAGGMSRLLPVLPNAAWFFYGSSENYLSLRDDQPATGFFVQTFRSPLLPSIFTLFAIPMLPFLLLPATRRWMRRLARVIVKEEAVALDVPVEDWHTYGLLWKEETVSFMVDGERILRTQVSPGGKLGFVMWIDNQYFRFTPEGKFGFGYQSTPSRQWLDVRNLTFASE
jgi:hypothetical protein